MMVDPEEPIHRADPRYVDLSAARGDEDFARHILRLARSWTGEGPGWKGTRAAHSQA